MPQTPTEWLGRTQVNSISIGFQGQQEIIGLSNGNILVVFSDDSETAPDFGRDIVGVIYDAEGNVVQAEFQLNTAFFFDGEEWPSIAATNDGGFIMVYEDSDASGTSIRAQRYDSQGDSVDTATILEDPGDVLLSNPQVAVNLDDNSFFVTYEHDDGGDNTIRGRLFDANMDPVDVERILRIDEDPTNSHIDGDPLRQDTVALTGGGFVTVFEERDVFNSATDPGIEFVLSNGGGANGVNGSVTGPDGIQDGSARVAALSDGGFVVTWMQAEVTDGLSNNNILYRIHDFDGVPRTAILTAANSLNNHFAPAVIGLEDGTFFLAWEDNSLGRLEGRLFSGADGSSIGSEIDIETSDSPINVELGTTTDGRILISYVTLSDGDVQFEIFDPRDTTITADIGDGQVTGRLDGSTIIGSNVSEILLGQAGNDTFVYPLGSTSSINVDTIDGGGGINTFAITLLEGQRIIDLQAGVFATGNISSTGATRSTLANIQNVIVAGAQDVRGDDGNNVITAVGDFANHFQGLGGTDVLSGGDGNDHLYGGLGDDQLIGGAGIDLARYDDANYGNLIIRLDLPGLNTGAAAGDTYVDIEGIIGGVGNDTIVGNNLANRLAGAQGTDFIHGSSGADTLDGGGDNDHLYGGLGADQLIGGAGIDFARYDDANYGNLVIRLDAPNLNTGAAAGDTYSGIECLVGGTGNDTVVGDNLANRLFGGGGTDFVHGKNGADILDGGDGNDHLYGGLGADQHIGGAGIDFARYDDANYGNLIIRLDAPNFNTGAAAGDTYSGIECLVAGAGNDTVVGDSLANRLFGQGGGDSILGRNGTDILDGGDGNDHLYGGLGADQHIGGAGIDFARYDDANYGNLVIRMDAPNLNTGAAAGDTYSGIECLVGGVGNDTVVGDNFSNRLYGGGGNDVVYGQNGYDIIDGGAGNDFLVGGANNDTLTGGANSDTFFFNATLNAATNVDTITDFSVTDDTIRLEDAIFTAIGPVGTLAASAFHIGSAATSAAHRIVYNSATGALIYDSNGSAAGGATQFAVLGTGLALTNADFLIT